MKDLGGQEDLGMNALPKPTVWHTSIGNKYTQLNKNIFQRKNKR